MKAVEVPQRIGVRSSVERMHGETEKMPLASVVGVLLIGAVILASYFGTLAHLVGRWSREPDYSHGFLVPIIAAWLLWRRRDLLSLVPSPVHGRWLGPVILLVSCLLRVFSVYFDFVLADAVALVVCIAGVPALMGGYSGIRWSWPGIVALLFMVPLPGIVAGRLSGPLQHLATVCSTFALQTLGVPAIASGNVIWLSHGKIGVVEACSGLRMLMMFGAVTMAAVFVLKLSPWEKITILLSSVAIAIVANVIRITATGVAHELVGPELAAKIFHDLAGWIMMPLAILMLGLEVVLLAKLFPTVPNRPILGAPYSGGSVPSSRSR
jgi:exosortase